MTSESTAAACTFSASGPRRRLARNRPVWIAVERRLPIAPKIAPRIAMAAGIRIASPTSSSSVFVIEASTMPAINSPTLEMNSAANPCRSDSFSRVR